MGWEIDRLAKSLVAIALLAFGCAENAPRPNVVLVIIDTLRADRLGCYGNPRGLTPFLDSLCAEGTVFANAYSSSSWTMPSIASLFTSRYAIQHGVARFESRLGASEITLAEIFSGAGYATTGFTANILLKVRRGYAQGFDLWKILPEGNRFSVSFAPAPIAVTESLLQWLDARSDSRPAFVYAHYMDPHSPYDAPPEFRRRFAAGVDPEVAESVNTSLGSLRTDEIDESGVAAARLLYDAEVAAVDAKLRRLFHGLERRGFLEHAVVVVTADHGEEFREHDRLIHGHTLYQAGVRVPLLILAPGASPGRVVPDAVSLIDVAPTLVDLAGLPPDPHFEGRSLVPILRAGGTLPEAPLLLELPHKGQEGLDIREHEIGLVRGADKLVIHPRGTAQRFDLDADPQELEPSAAMQSDRGRELHTLLVETRRILEERAAPSPDAIDLDEATRDELRALGYLR